MGTLRLLFGMQTSVRQMPYVIWGAILMGVKYLGEGTIYYLAQGKWLSPLNFFSPVLFVRYPDFSNLPDWFGPAVVLWSIPFIWIGVGMSIRRAGNAGVTPWTGLLFFVPVINYVLMILLSLAPPSKNDQWGEKVARKESSLVVSPFAIALIFAALGTLLTWFSTNFLETYATSLFIGSPVILGIVQSYFLNRPAPINFIKTVVTVCTTILMIHLFLLIFALEGVLCLAMSLPLATALGILGSVFGAGIANYSKSSPLSPTALVLALPIMPWMEAKVIRPHQDVVVSIVNIDAKPEAVWPNVVKFSDLPPNEDWLFKLGVAHPLRARIEGEGVGAVRRCEFSTGAFVEPITVWDEPHRLAFNVQYQPQPMRELTFYDHVDAPHLDGYFRSVKGEFRLVKTADGKTRLEGRTWYEMDMQPGWYWQIYGRWFIHKIHHRVLVHIKDLSEKTASAR